MAGDLMALWAEGDVAGLRAAIEREDDFGVYGRAEWAIAEIERLRAALRDIANVLGTGACKNIGCDGCAYEMDEAADIAREALALPADAPA